MAPTAPPKTGNSCVPGDPCTRVCHMSYEILFEVDIFVEIAIDREPVMIDPVTFDE